MCLLTIVGWCVGLTLAAQAAPPGTRAQASQATTTGPSTRVVELPPPGDPAWQALEFARIDERTSYEVRRDPAGRAAFRARSACGASAMRMALPEDIDLAATPRLAWRWRIERGLDIAAERDKLGDDFAARVYVMFAFDAESASWIDRAQRSVGRRLFGVEVPGKTLNYVWASREAVGARWTSPYHPDAHLVAVESGSAAAAGSGWRETIVDWNRDSAQLFESGRRQPPYAVAVMVDADNTCAEAIAWFSDFRLLGPSEPVARE